MAEVNRTLKLEEATLKDPERISGLAKDQMGWRCPRWDRCSGWTKQVRVR